MNTNPGDKYKIKMLFLDGNIREETFDTRSEMDKNYEFFKGLNTIQNASVQEIKVFERSFFQGDNWEDEIVKSGDLWYKSIL